MTWTNGPIMIEAAWTDGSAGQIIDRSVTTTTIDAVLEAFEHGITTRPIPMRLHLLTLTLTFT
jgi:hypothetical protein